MKRIIALALTLSSIAIPSRFAYAQGSANPVPPVVKILAIARPGTSTAGPEVRNKILPTEAREAVKLYLGGKVDQWYYRKDTGSVIFILNVTTTDEARSLLESLPLGKAHLLTFDYIPLSPMVPLGLLIAEQPESSK